jgi:acyl carrier protein
LDSLSFVGIIVKLEEEFEVEFDLDELGVLDWKTVGDIINGVEDKLNEKK